jgi:hypothetical protein
VSGYFGARIEATTAGVAVLTSSVGVSIMVSEAATFGITEIVTAEMDVELDAIGEQAESKITNTAINRELLFMTKSFHSSPPIKYR